MRLASILALAGDRGGFNAVIPVLNFAAIKGFDIKIILTATCAKQYADRKLQVRPDIAILTASGTEDIERQVGQHSSDVLVIASSQSSEGTLASLAAIRAVGQRNILLLEDMYGSAYPTLQLADKQDMLKRIQAISVTDKPAKELLCDRLPSVVDRVCALGGPQYDNIRQMRNDFEDRRRELRTSMGVADTQPVFLVVGGLNGTAEILEMLEQAIQDSCAERNPKIILRQHPRATADDNRQVECYLGGSPCRKRIIGVSAATSEDILPGVEFVLSGYSTTNRYGIYLGILGVVYIGIPSIHADFQREKGDLKKPLEATAGAAWYVKNPKQLQSCIRDVLTNTVPRQILKAQLMLRETCDGAATQRVFDKIRSLL